MSNKLKELQTLNSKTDGVIFPDMNFGTICSEDGTEAEFHVLTKVRFKKDGIWYIKAVRTDNKLVCDRDILGASYAVNDAVKLCLEIIDKKEINEYTFLDENQGD